MNTLEAISLLPTHPTLPHAAMMGILAALHNPDLYNTGGGGGGGGMDNASVTVATYDSMWNRLIMPNEKIFSHNSKR